MSRLSNVRAAVRPALKARMMLSGPAGAGKTRSALIVAGRLTEGGRVLVIDTEKESALTYADDFTFEHLAWAPPFDPRELATTLLEAGEIFDAIIIDSLSHFWRGSGGTLDIADGKFTGWKAARPAQEDLVAGILDCKAHVILCGRAKVDHVQEVDERGKHVVRKLGMATIQDDTLEYELNVAVEIDMEHRLTVAKSRSVAVPVGRTFAPGHAEDFADLYREWLAGGEPPADQAKVAALIERMNALPPEQRKACKQEFVARFGRPDHLPESRLVEAEAFVRDHKAPEPNPAEKSGPGFEPGPILDDQGQEIPFEDEDEEPLPAEPAADGGGEVDERLPMRRLFALMAEYGVTDDIRHDWATNQIGREITSFSDLTDEEVAELTSILRTGRHVGVS